MTVNKSSSPLLTLALAAGVAIFAAMPITARAALWTNQLGGNWLNTNNWNPNSLPSGGGPSGEADFRGNWTTAGELVITTDLTPDAANTSVPRFRNVIYNDTGADPDATLTLTGTNVLTFYHATAGSYPWINASAASSVVRVGVEIESQNENSITAIPQDLAKKGWKLKENLPQGRS
jgi:hypothetical protein